MTFSSWAKTALWSATMSNVTGTRGTVGVGVGLAVGPGMGVISGPTAPTTGVAIGLSSGSRSALSSGGALTTTVSGAGAIGDGTGEEPVDLGDGSVEQVAGPERIGRDRADADDGDDQPEGDDGNEEAAGTATAGRAGHAGRLTCGWWRCCGRSTRWSCDAAANRTRPQRNELKSTRTSSRA